MVMIRNATRDSTISAAGKRAASFWARGRGLMFTDGLPEDGALVIEPCSSIHMFFMRFSLDVLYVDREDRVVRVQQGIKPWRLGPLFTPGARYVIELPVGTIQRSGTQVGDQLMLSASS
jgi:uncharacterized membrane protein (UPF0127 family)